MSDCSRDTCGFYALKCKRIISVPFCRCVKVEIPVSKDCKLKSFVLKKICFAQMVIAILLNVFA